MKSFAERLFVTALVSFGLPLILPGTLLGQGGIGNWTRCEVCSAGICSSMILPGHEACVEYDGWCSEEGDPCSPHPTLRDVTPEGGILGPVMPSVRAEEALLASADDRGVVYTRVCNGGIVTREYPKAEERRIRVALREIEI